MTTRTVWDTLMHMPTQTGRQYAGTLVREEVARRGTVEEVAEFIGLAPRTLYKVRAGESVSLRTLMSVNDRLGFPESLLPAVVDLDVDRVARMRSDDPRWPNRRDEIVEALHDILRGSNGPDNGRSRDRRHA